MNKKAGMEQSKVIGWIIAIAILLFIFLVIFPMFQENSDTVKEFAINDKVDFDGDNPSNNYVNDRFDPCPCGSQNSKITYQGKEFCIADWDANKCQKANFAIWNEGESSKFFMISVSGNQESCLYTVNYCRELINWEPSFNEKYAIDPNSITKKPKK